MRSNAAFLAAVLALTSFQQTLGKRIVQSEQERPETLETRLVSILDNHDEVQSLLKKALVGIVFERHLLCPAKQIVLADLKPECCSMATREVPGAADNSRAPVTTMEFSLNGFIVTVRFQDDELVDIEPHPCGWTLEADQESLDDGYTGLDHESETIVKTASSISEGLQSHCPDLDEGLITVEKIHGALTKVVEGLTVKAIAELGNGALHRFEVQFDLDGNFTEIVSDVGCHDLGTSTLPAHVITELQAASKARLATAEKSSSLIEVRRYFSTSGGHLETGTREAAAHRMSDSELHSMLTSNVSLPESYDPAKASPKCFPSSMVSSQGSCGSCWLMASIGAVGDRHCLANPSSMIDASGWRYTLSAQQVLSCHSTNGCDGGNADWVYEPMMWGEMNLTYTKKYPYAARCFEDTDGVTQDWGASFCSSYRNVSDNDPGKPCRCVAKRLKQQPSCDKAAAGDGVFSITNYHNLPKPGDYIDMWLGTRYSNWDIVKLAQTNIFEAGPIYASFDVHEDFGPFVGIWGARRVYRHTSGKFEGGHAVVMVGWGLSGLWNDVPYWRIRNSWGAGWGDKGHYHHVRGENDCGIESRITVPEVKKVLVFHELKFENATAFTTKKGLGFRVGEKEHIWHMDIKCNMPCSPIFASFPQLQNQDQVALGSGSSKCCCNRMHQTCAWVPKEELVSSDVWVLSSTPTCGKYNFGRGLVQTQEVEGSECGSKILGREEKIEGMPLKISNKDATTIRIDLDLATIPDHWYENLELFVKASSAHHDTQVQELFEVKVTPSAPKVVKQFSLRKVNTFFERVDEPYEIQNIWGRHESKTREYYVVRVVASCSQQCSGTAIFQDLDAAHHPKGMKILEMPTKASENSKELVWSEKVRVYPAGVWNLKVTVWQSAEKRKKISKVIPIDIPSLGGSTPQGVLWKPFTISDGETRVLTKRTWSGLDKPNQVLQFRCSRPCKLRNLQAAQERTYRGSVFPVGSPLQSKPEDSNSTSTAQGIISVRAPLEQFGGMRNFRIAAIVDDEFGNAIRVITSVPLGSQGHLDLVQEKYETAS